VHDHQAAPARIPRLDLGHRVTLIPTVRRTPGRSAAYGIHPTKGRPKFHKKKARAAKPPAALFAEVVFLMLYSPISSKGVREPVADMQ
jgi:hypothetical protein